MPVLSVVLARSALLLSAAFLVVAGGAYPRYNRIVYGAPLLALALASVGAVAWRRPHRSRPWTTAGCAVFAALVTAIWVRPSIAGATRPDPPMYRTHVLLTLPTDRLRAALASELQPVDIAACRMERFGETHDGGYLMCGNLLESSTAVYSYGIGPTDQWGCDVARRLRVPLHQYDCFDPSRPVCPGVTTTFHGECIGPERGSDEDGRAFDTLEHQLARNGHGGARVIVKMDIEGAEWDTLLQAPEAVLERIDQLAIELHGVGQEKHVAAARRLRAFFHVAHVHFTNFACGPRLDPFPAWAYEVLFVNKRLARAGAARVWAPTRWTRRRSLERRTAREPRRAGRSDASHHG